MTGRARLLGFMVALTAVLGCQRKVPEPDVVPPSVVSVDVGRAPVGSVASGAAEPTAPATQVTQLVKEDLAPGQGAPAKNGDRVRVHYTGALLDGTKFDSSLDRGEPFEFRLGQGEVIKGWDQGVVGMKKHGKRRLTIPSQLAYGQIGSPPKIPPNATLKFEIELLDIANP